MLGITKLSRLMVELPIHVFLVLLSFAKLSSLNISLFTVPEPEHQTPGERPNILTLVLVVAAAPSLLTFLFLVHHVPLCPPALWIQQ